jgi:hypothetical protein
VKVFNTGKGEVVVWIAVAWIAETPEGDEEGRPRNVAGPPSIWRDMALVAALMLTYGGPAKAPPPAQSTTFTIRRIARRAERARQMGAPHQPIAPILHAEPEASRVPARARDAEPATA